MMMRLFLLGVLMLLLQISWTQNVEEQFELANQSYNKKDYSTAIEQYENILDQGYQSADLHYNLANAYYRNREIGEAILHYERASRLKPRDKDIQHNLSFAQAQLQDEIEVLPPFFLARWWQNVQQLFSSNVWSVLSMLLLWGGIAGFVLWQLGSQRKQRQQGFIIGCILLFSSIFPVFWAMGSSKAEAHSREAILLVAATNLQSAPDAESATIMELHEGIKIALIDQINNWYKVRLSNGEEGWLPFEVVEEI